MKTPEDAYRGNVDKLPAGSIPCKGFPCAGYMTATLVGARMELSDAQAQWYRRVQK